MTVGRHSVRVAMTALALCFASSGLYGQEEPRLRDGYVVCEAPGQLSFFMEPNVFDFLERPAPDSVRVYPDGHPSKKADMMVGGRFRTVTKGHKALSRGWCHKTSEVAGARVQGVGSCSDLLPEFPNGGCAKITIRIGNKRMWFTFGDALAQNEGQRHE